MALSVEQLITQTTRDEALTLLIDILDSLGYPASSWQSGSIQRSLLEAFAELTSQLVLTQTLIAKAGFNDTAAGDWLTMLSDSHYDDQRLAAIATQGTCTLIDGASTGPHVFVAGDIVVADANGVRFRNTAGGAIPDGPTATLPAVAFEAETAGAAGNVANDAITVVVEGPPGLTVSNPAVGTTWITRNGADEEGDSVLQARNRAKWATLGYAGPRDAYENWALAASAVVTRVYVDDANPRGAGTIDVYLAGASGGVAAGVITAVSDSIQGLDGIGRRPLGANVIVYTAVALAITVTGTAYLASEYNTAATQAAIDAAVDAYFASLPIGGVHDANPAVGKFLLSGLYFAILTVPGVVNFVPTAPLVDTVMGVDEVAVRSGSLTFANATF